jgi:hypothetical protein
LDSIISIDIYVHVEKPRFILPPITFSPGLWIRDFPFMHFSQEVSEEIKTDKRVERGTGNQTVNRRREKGRKNQTNNMARTKLTADLQL